MAKNYQFSEAVKIITEGTDLEAIQDIGRRFPLLLQKVATVAAKAGDSIVDLASYMPEYLTANKVNAGIKKVLLGLTGDEDEATDEAPTESGGIPNYEAMGAKELWKILGDAGKRKTAASTKKPDLVAACLAMHANADTDDENDDEEAGKYDGKSAMELFKECKKRGLSVEPKKNAKYYADLLTANDSEESSDEDENWDEDEKPVEKAEKPVKPAVSKPKPAGRPSTKTDAKAAAKGADAGDDWDI